MNSLDNSVHHIRFSSVRAAFFKNDLIRFWSDMNFIVHICIYIMFIYLCELEFNEWYMQSSFWFFRIFEKGYKGTGYVSFSSYLTCEAKISSILFPVEGVYWFNYLFIWNVVEWELSFLGFRLLTSLHGFRQHLKFSLLLSDYLDVIPILIFSSQYFCKRSYSHCSVSELI